MKRKLLLPIIFSQALIPNVYAAAEVDSVATEQVIQDEYEGMSSLNKRLQALCDNEKIANLENVKDESNKIWKTIIETIKSSRIKLNSSIDFSPISNTVLALDNTTISENSLGERFSGVDKWSVKLSVLPFSSKIADLGVSGSREVTFIQQFDSKCKSLARSGYDPVTKIPTTAERALKRLKPGDFVAFAAPLTISLGKNIERFFEMAKLTSLLHAGFNAEMSVFATGEFNVHIFRMENNYVRVRFFDSQGMGVTAGAGLKVFGIKLLGKDMLNVTPLEFSFKKSDTDIFSADYVFNLNDPASRDLYDKLMSQKLDFTDSLSKTNLNPFISKEELEKHAFSDLTEIDKASLEDSGKLAANRRILRLSKGMNSTKSSSFKIGANFFRLIKAKSEVTKSKSNISMFNVDNENTKYNINMITDQTNFRFFEIWGQQDTHSTALLTIADDKYVPQATKGLQTFRLKEELTFTKAEMHALKRRLIRTLPQKISEKLNLPDDSQFSSAVANVRIEQSLFINSNVLEQQGVFTSEAIQNAINEILQHWGKFSSDPVDSAAHNTEDDSDPRGKLKLQADYQYSRGKDVSQIYAEAYARDLALIQVGLKNMFSTDVNMAERIQTYENLRKNKLFNEIGSALILKVIPNEIIEKSVVYKLSISGRGIDNLTEFPKDADDSATNIFLQVLRENSFMRDRSFNLRYYLNEKGFPLTLTEVIERAK